MATKLKDSIVSIEAINGKTWRVLLTSGEKHFVTYTGGVWGCSCPGIRACHYVQRCHQLQTALVGLGQEGEENDMVSRIDGPIDEEMTALRAAREEQAHRAACYPDLLAALEEAAGWLSSSLTARNQLTARTRSNVLMARDILKAAVAKAKGVTL